MNLQTKPILIEVSAGELLDKISVLQVKSEKLTNAQKLANVKHELDILLKARDLALPACPTLDKMAAELKAINRLLYDTIDEIYECERRGLPTEEFVERARRVYRLNDTRAMLKRDINTLVGSPLVEEKGHELVNSFLKPK